MPPFGGWHGNKEINEKFMPLIKEAGIDLMLCAHLHRYVHQKPEMDTHFPIIVNSNNTVLQVEAGQNEMRLKVIDTEGKIVDQFNVTR